MPDYEIVPDYEYDVALSFAGEDRVYVHRVATVLRERGIAVFYDEFSTVELWGQDLYSYLDDVYRNRSRYAVVFASASYARSLWTSHERQSIQARVLVDKNVFLLPVRLDDTEIPGLRRTTGFLSGEKLSGEALAELIVAKVGQTPARDPLPALSFAVPLTAEDNRRVLALRPAAWEHLIFAGIVWQQWQRLETKRLDHELAFSAGPVQHVPADQLGEFMRSALDELMFALSKLEALIGGDRFEWAMGAPGVPGDSIRIEHLGRRIGAGFEAVLDWAARVRSTVSDARCRDVLELLARMADEPAYRMGEFVNSLVTAVGRIAGHASTGSAVALRVTVTLELTIAASSIQAFDEEVKALGGRLSMD